MLSMYDFRLKKGRKQKNRKKIKIKIEIKIEIRRINIDGKRKSA